MVVFEHGEPRPAAYRRFKIKSVEGANDVASIREVIRRRFERAAAALESGDHPEAAGEGAPPQNVPDEASSESLNGAQRERRKALEWAQLPDLLLIDGGRGQLNAALEVLRELGFEHIPTVGIAKGADRNRFDLVRPEQPEPLALERDSMALYLVQRVDEEAHRFAITYHRKLRGKASTASLLDEVPGIGPRRKRALLKEFGSLDGIRGASVEQLAAVPGMTRTAAEELKGLL
jgi:excinuclease ABC subunit C